MSSESEKVVRDLEVTPKLMEQIRKEVPKSKYITPQLMAMRYNIRVSVARKLLKQLLEEGLVVYVDGNSRLRIYRGAKVKQKTEKESGEMN